MHEPGNIDDRSRDVHSILGPRVQHWQRDFRDPLGHHFDECLRGSSKYRYIFQRMPAYDVEIYGNLEWCFKWMKILLIIMLCIVMIAIKAGG